METNAQPKAKTWLYEKYTLCHYLILFLTILSACLSIVYRQLEIMPGNVAKPAEEQEESLD
jgi:hypothetical protein